MTPGLVLKAAAALRPEAIVSVLAVEDARAEDIVYHDESGAIIEVANPISDDELASYASDPDVEKAEHNDPIDAQIESLERGQILPRICREYMLVDAVNTVLAAQGINVSSATNAQRAAAMAALVTPTSSLYSLGIAKLKAFDDVIVALRAQRIP